MSIFHSCRIQPEVTFGFKLVIMSHVLFWLLLVVSLTLQTHGVKPQDYNEDSLEGKVKSNGGMTVLDLMKQSVCQPRKTLIKVHDEFPNEMQYDILPSCVQVQRCLGCCRDEALKCLPKKNETVELKVVRIYSVYKNETVVLPFVKHASCSCRYQRDNKN